MSCQKIIYIPVAKIAPTAVVGMAGAPLVFGIAAVAVAGLVAWQLKDAQERLDKKQAEALALEKVRAEVRRRKEEMTRFNEALAEAGQESIARRAAELELADVRLSDRRRRKQRQSADHQDGAPSPAAATAQKARMLLLELENLLNCAPAAYKSAERSPFSRFQSERESLARSLEKGPAPLLEDILDFKQSLLRSLARFQQESQARTDAAENLLNDMQEMHRYLQTVPFLTDRDEYGMEAAALDERLAELAGDAKVDRAAYLVLKKDLDRLKEMIEVATTWRAYRQALARTLTRHLGEMGYREIDGFPDRFQEEAQAVMAVPGGERIRVAVQTDGRMAFDLLHETKSEHPITEEEKAFYRRQEERWRRDFKELVRRLTRDGFSYEVELAKLADEQSIPVAVLETAESFLSEEEERQRGIESRKYLKR